MVVQISATWSSLFFTTQHVVTFGVSTSKACAQVDAKYKDGLLCIVKHGSRTCCYARAGSVLCAATLTAPCPWGPGSSLQSRGNKRSQSHFVFHSCCTPRPVLEPQYEPDLEGTKISVRSANKVHRLTFAVIHSDLHGLVKLIIDAHQTVVWMWIWAEDTVFIHDFALRSSFTFILSAEFSKRFTNEMQSGGE